MNDTRRALLAALADGPVAGPQLADELGVSRAAVWKQVEGLREEGFEVSSDDDGYAVESVPEYGGAAIEFGLEAPFAVEFHASLPSTNDRARELAAEGLEDVVVVADEQTGGRGRLSRAWNSPSGGIWTSLLVRPDVPPAHAPVFTLAAAVAVTRAAREAGVDAGIKWPNDVIVSEANNCTSDSRESDGVVVSGASDGSSDGSDGVAATAAGDDAKLAGILTEMEGEANRVSWLVVGVGVNANVALEDLPERATSLRAEVGDVDRRVFVQRVLEEFDSLRGDPESVLDAWREHARTLGRRVRVETPGGVVEGEAADVVFPGALVVDTGEGEVTVHAGDCEHLRPA
jgi:BirA family biotin operon repressor/biotin-[acetyl-CoA-carboxylase] ligase